MGIPNPNPKKKRLKPVHDALFKMEDSVNTLLDHGFQWGDLIFMLYGYLMVHRPDAREEYDEGGHPVLYYGPEDK